MFNECRIAQHSKYNEAREEFIQNPQVLIELEEFLANEIVASLTQNLAEIKRDYNEASYLYPFWQTYPPESRGRQPVGDQFPWIEVGEHAVGGKLSSFFKDTGFAVRDAGLPVGTDQRFIVGHNTISVILAGLSSYAWLFADIKSVGPRDDFPHAVMSHNQISGDGIWEDANEGVSNSVMTAIGTRTSHAFHCSLPPLFVLSDGVIAPTVICAVKPVYKMLSLDPSSNQSGQPLDRITVITIPNGLLLEKAPGYLETHPGLLFPGKDDKKKNPLKVRARICFEKLADIAPWRVQTINL